MMPTFVAKHFLQALTRAKQKEPLNPRCMPQELQAQLAQVRASKGQSAVSKKADVSVSEL